MTDRNNTVAAPRRYEAVIKIDVDDPPDRRAVDISDGLAYACALLMDEYGYTAASIADILAGLTDAAYAAEGERRD